MEAEGFIMSLKEQCIELINSFDESQLLIIAQILSDLKDAVDDEADDEFCSALYDKAVADDDGYRVSSRKLKEKIYIMK